MAIDYNSRRERFNRSEQNRQAAKNNFGGYERKDPVDYVALEVIKNAMRSGKMVMEGRPLQLRFVGDLAESNPRMPGDMKHIPVASIRYFEGVTTLDELLTAQSDPKATRKYTQIIFPEKSERRSHPLWKLLDLILAYTWNEEKRERDYHHVNDDLFPLYKELRYNGDPSNKNETGWNPNDTYLMNCIDRAQMAWHKENKKTLVLSRGSWMSKDKDGNEVQRFDTGVRKTVYDGLCNRLNQTYGFHEDYDVIVWRVDGRPYYEIEHALHGFEAPFWEKGGFKRQDSYLEARLTEEELPWKLWDFDKFFKPTTDDRIFNRLGYMFKIYDDFMATKGKTSNLWREMSELAEKAKAQRAEDQKNKVAQDNAEGSEEEEGEAQVPAETAAPAPAQTQAAVTKVPESQPQAAPSTTVASRRTAAPAPAASAGIPWAKLEDGSYNGIEYKGVSLMTDEEKAQVLSINEDGSFNYAENAPDGTPNEIAACTESDFSSPMWFHVDPKSGLLFQ